MMPRNKITNDLEYLASLGFESSGVTEDEISELVHQVKQKYHPYNSGGYFFITCSLTALLIMIPVFFMFYDVPYDFDLAAFGPAPKNTSSNVISMNRAGEAIQEHGEIKENFIRMHKEQKIEPVSEVQDREPVSVLDPVQANILPVKPQEEQLEEGINTPVTFIHDLKVSNYNLLYFRKKDQNEISGVPASFSARTNMSAERPTTSNTFVHEQLAEALLYYKKGYYEYSRSLLLEIWQLNEKDLNCNFYIAMCNYHLKRYDSALKGFEKCLDDLNNAFAQEARYYKALTLEASGQEEEAISLMRHIANSNEFYKAKAIGFLRDHSADD